MDEPAALAGLRDSTRAKAMAFCALDAVFYALGLAATITFGLRRLGLGSGWPRLVVLLPLVVGVRDLIENAAFTALMALPAAGPAALVGVAGVLSAAN